MAADSESDEYNEQSDYSETRQRQWLELCKNYNYNNNNKIIIIIIIII
jgi:hypothetical protein